MAIDLSALLEDDRPKHNYKANADLEQAVKLYQEGISVKKIIDKTNVSTATLYKELKAQGISKRSSSNNIKLRGIRDGASNLDNAVKLYQEGASIRTILKETNLSSNVLYAELDNRGIKRRGGINNQNTQLVKPEPDKVPGFWKRLKYAFSANTNDLKG